MSFRFHAHEKATKLNLSGWVQNLRDGRVELVVAGSEKAVRSMIEWANEGPPLAQVEDIEMIEVKGAIATEPFFIKR